MKEKQAALVVVLLFLGGLGMAFGSLSRERAQPPGQSFAISEYGTLLDVFDANGKSRFGKIVGDGFDVSYKIRRKTAAASALGTTTSGLQRGSVESDGQSATSIVVTRDNALEITSYFILDENAKELIIARQFRNLSRKPMTLQVVWAHVGSNLATGSPPESSSIRGSIYGPGSDCQMNHPAGRDCPMCKCPPGPCPGRTCPPLPLPGEKGDIILAWKQGIKLGPRQQRAHAGAAALPLPENEAFIVIHVSLK